MGRTSERGDSRLRKEEVVVYEWRAISEIETDKGSKREIEEEINCVDIVCLIIVK